MDHAQFETLLGAFTAAVERDGGTALAALFTEDGVYHDVFYGAFEGRPKIAWMLEDHFWAHGENYRWAMHEPIVSGDIGYAHWTFSFTSKLPEAAGKRVVWDGMSRFQLRGELIAHYKEVFDIAIALTQTAFPADRIARVAGKHVQRLRSREAGGAHLPEQRYFPGDRYPIARQ
jgi:ketosteroid isomerase-like protein